LLEDGLIDGVVRMLCADVVHGDLSEYYILIGSDGPVIIDLPQAVDAAGNNHAPKILERVQKAVDLDSVLRQIDDAHFEDAARVRGVLTRGCRRLLSIQRFANRNRGEPDGEFAPWNGRLAPCCA
jgi:tRNA A-37 threonylcarbamoyl transferase component Bud32